MYIDSARPSADFTVLSNRVSIWWSVPMCVPVICWSTNAPLVVRHDPVRFPPRLPCCRSEYLHYPLLVG